MSDTQLNDFPPDDNSTPLNHQQDEASFQTKLSSVGPDSEEALKEEQKEPEVSYDSLIITLKEKNKELRKMEVFKKKLEDRFKDKNKEIKEIKRQKDIVDSFVR